MQIEPLVKRCKKFVFPFSAILLLLNGCGEKQTKEEQMKRPVVYLQPFNGMPGTMVNDVAGRLKKYYPAIRINKAIDLPAAAWYAPRQRFKADSIIKFLQQQTTPGHFTIGLTGKDISTSKNKIADWGVMGLGYCPGRACVASSFRLPAKQKTEFLFKVAIHELGHTQGLPHCPQKTCYMRDAEGGNPLKEETAFCAGCTLFLKNKGWTINEEKN